MWILNVIYYGSEFKFVNVSLICFLNISYSSFYCYRVWYSLVTINSTRFFLIFYRFHMPLQVILFYHEVCLIQIWIFCKYKYSSYYNCCLSVFVNVLYKSFYICCVALTYSSNELLCFICLVFFAFSKINISKLV